VAQRGLAATTVEQIAEAAEVGRATFFRYFDAKEWAVAEGAAAAWLELVTDRLRAQPPHLGPLDAIRTAFAELAVGFDDRREEVLPLAELSRSSPALSAWTLQVYLRYEDAIAALVAPRFAQLSDGDPRPRLVGALTMAALRLALDDWVADGGRGDLPALVDRALCAATVPDGALR